MPLQLGPTQKTVSERK